MYSFISIFTIVDVLTYMLLVYFLCVSIVVYDSFVSFLENYIYAVYILFISNDYQNAFFVFKKFYLRESMSRVRERSKRRGRRLHVELGFWLGLNLSTRDDHDLRCRQTLNRLSLPDYQNSVLVFYFSFFEHLGRSGYFCNINVAFSSLLSVTWIAPFFLPWLCFPHVGGWWCNKLWRMNIVEWLLSLRCL